MSGVEPESNEQGSPTPGLDSHTCQPSRSSRKDWLWLALILATFLALRVPVIYRQPGGEDEDAYAIPGLLVLKSGIPQLPNFPSRDTASIFYRADKALFAEPPLLFYVEGLFFALLPDVYGTARLVSTLSGVGVLVMVFLLGRKLTGHASAGLWAAGLMSLSRWFLFTAIRARPDMLCALFGLLAFWFLLNWRDEKRNREIIIAGVCLGLGGLTHPFALAYALQAGLWVLIFGSGHRRWLQALLLTLAAVAVTGLWLPLIALEPEAFRVQFHNQFIAGSDGSLLGRMLWPWRSFSFHFRFVWEAVNPWQTMLLFGSCGLVLCKVGRRTDSRSGIAAVLCLSGFYLLMTLVGAHHQILGYFVYAAAWGFVCVGEIIATLMNRFRERFPLGQFAAVASGVLLIGSLIPGSGITATWVYVRHWNDINYNAPRFARQMLSRYPADARYTVDTHFTLDFVAAGRNTISSQTHALYFRADRFPYDYLILSRYALKGEIEQQLHAIPLETFGNRADIMACYAEVFVPDPAP